MTMQIHEDHPELQAIGETGAVVGYFGYGSLVNKATLRTKFLAIRKAEVTGWRRFWMPLPGEGVLLSVRPEPSQTTQGVVVYDHADNLAAVDERESGYIRRALDKSTLSIEGAPPLDAPIYIYEAIATEATAAETGAPIHQSYLDAVLQGFLTLYGRTGLERFVAETEGFETDILSDRHAPIYPRAVSLLAGEADLFDALVSARGARFRA